MTPMRLPWVFSSWEKFGIESSFMSKDEGEKSRCFGYLKAKRFFCNKKSSEGNI